jgi:hypothetical protein
MTIKFLNMKTLQTLVAALCMTMAAACTQTTQTIPQSEEGNAVIENMY